MISAATLRSSLQAARPKTLPAAIVPVWTGCVLAWAMQGVFDPWLATCTLMGALAIQLATNFFNDAIDHRKGADTSRRLGPQRVAASGLLSERGVMGMASGFLVVAIVFGLVLYQARGWPVLFIGLPSLFLAYGYTGGPYPLAYRGMGEIFVIGVDPAHHGKGLGRRLVVAGLDHLATRNVDTGMLYVDSTNERAIATYESLGFRPHRRDVAWTGRVQPR